MKKIFTIQTLFFALIFIGGICVNNISAQCETWTEPTTTTSWGDFNDMFGGAPCEGETGCQTNEITDFQVYASESYLINKFIKGGEYSFSMCNGPGAGSWVPEFTIVAPSGAIDAFGAGDGDSCTISWIATESGSYTIIINELDSCGTLSNSTVDNGYPAITCLGNTPCPDYCNDWTSPAPGGGWTDFNTNFGGAPCDDGSGCAVNEITDFEVFASEAYSIDNFQEGGEYSFSMCNGPGAGTWVPRFTIIAPSGEVDAEGGGDGDSCTISWTASESGTYLIVINEEGFCGDGDNTDVANGFPAITCLGNTMCDTTMAACAVGSIASETNVVVCGDQDSVIILMENVTIPDGGGIAYGFAPGEGGTGGNGTGFSITGSSVSTAFDNGIGGLLEANNLPILQGEWIITPFIYTEAGNAANSLCELSDSTITAYFNSDLAIEVTDLGSGSAMVTASGGSEPYTYAWSDPDSGTTGTIEGLSEGDYNVTVTDAVGCSSVGTVTVMISAVSNLKDVQHFSVAPNPTTGQIWVNYELNESSSVNLKLMDINGRLMQSESYHSSSEKIALDLAKYSNGVYFINIETESETIIRKIILAK